MDIAATGDGRASRVSPREVEMIRFRDGKVPVKIQLMTDETIEGVIAWYDDLAMHIVKPDNTETTVFYNVISTYSRR